MVSWTALCPRNGAGEDGWAALLKQARDGSPWQSCAWARYRQRFGWEPERWVAKDEQGRLVACMQVLQKAVPLHGVAVWAPGGPVLGFARPGSETMGELMAQWLEAFQRNHRLVYARICSLHEWSDEAAASLRRAWRVPAVRLSSHATVRLDLAVSPERLRASMSRKHRYYVKRAERCPIAWAGGNSQALVDDLVCVHEEMCRIKGLGWLRLGRPQWEVLREALGSDLFVLVGRQEGRPIVGCAVLTVADRAFFFLSAAGAEGRRMGASYAMMMRLFERLSSVGIASLDLGGMSAVGSSAAGVDHFKRGFGGVAVRYLGEWEWSGWGPIRLAANIAIRWQGAGRAPARDVTARTAHSYGYLWSRSTVAEATGAAEPYHWEQMAQGLGLPLPQGLVLDAGCGEGIDLANQARRPGVEVVGVELSFGGCRASAARCRGLPRAFVIQGDLSRLPLGDDTFDFIYSYGVLHHLTSPVGGLQELVRVLKPGSRIALYVYEDFRDRPLGWRVLLAMANGCRSLTTSLPPALLYRLCLVGSPIMFGLFTLPHRMLRRVPGCRSVAASFPFRHGTGPFSLVGDLYDRFSAPIERRYTREAALALVQQAGLEEVRIANDRGWMIVGSKPRGREASQARRDGVRDDRA